MEYDLNEISGINKKNEIYDVVICGAGVSGITVARKLVSFGKKVLLLEAGDLQPTTESQEIYQTHSIGVYYSGKDTCRLRYFGGTSNHWAGRCMTFEDVDFEDRPYFGIPSWPITKNDLDKYFLEACDILDITPDDFQPWEFNNFKSDIFFAPIHAASPPTRFGKKFRTEITTSNKIDFVKNANVIDFEFLNDTFTQKCVIAKNYHNKTFKFYGKIFVLACGTIENARILLNINLKHNIRIGNRYDMIGKCFMEHFNVDLGRFVADRQSLQWKSQFELYPTANFVKKNNIGSSVIAFHPNIEPDTYGRLAELKRVVRDALCSSEPLTNLARNIKDFDCPGDGIITTLCEQAPNKNSYITICKEKDKIGLHKACIHWDISDNDRRTIRTLAISAAKELARLDIARIQLPSYIYNDEEDIETYFHCHQMGTTRMSTSEEHGVVDKNCKVFGTKNLYIAGSSVFSTGSGVNPTFTIVQLSLRLAEYLAHKHKS